jgi:hypothetical protein
MPMRRWRFLPRRRPALGARATATPAIVFILIGVALGPHGLGALSPSVVASFDPVVWVALGLMGVFAGLGLAAAVRQSDVRLLAGGVMAPLVTTAVVAAGLSTLITSWRLPLVTPAIALSLMIGLCCAVSAARHTSAAASVELARAARVADLDDLAPVLIGSALLATLSGPHPGVRLVATLVAGGAIGTAGWLLFERAQSTAERGVFVPGIVFLLAGIGTYLGTSPLLSGGIAALLWVVLPGGADRLVAEDLRVLQHPLMALLLIIAGAQVDWTPAVVWIAGALIILQLAGKLAATLAVARLSRIPSALLATVLLPPGLMGIALALNARQLLGADYGLAVSTVTTAAAAFEIAAWFVHQEREGDA